MVVGTGFLTQLYQFVWLNHFRDELFEFENGKQVVRELFELTGDKLVHNPSS